MRNLFPGLVCCLFCLVSLSFAAAPANAAWHVCKYPNGDLGDVHQWSPATAENYTYVDEGDGSGTTDRIGVSATTWTTDAYTAGGGGAGRVYAWARSLGSVEGNDFRAYYYVSSFVLAIDGFVPAGVGWVELWGSSTVNTTAFMIQGRRCYPAGPLSCDEVETGYYD